MPKNKINLLPQEDFEKKPLGRFLLWALSAGRWLVIITELIVISVFLARFKLDRDINDLHEAIKQKQMIVQSYSPFEKDFRAFQKRLAMIKTLEKQKTDVGNILSTVSRVLPNDLVLSQFSLADDNVTISGLALSEEGLGSFIAGLSSSSKFKNLNLSNITKKQTEAGINFNLSATLVKEEANNGL